MRRLPRLERGSVAHPVRSLKRWACQCQVHASATVVAEQRRRSGACRPCQRQRFLGYRCRSPRACPAVAPASRTRRPERPKSALSVKPGCAGQMLGTCWGTGAIQGASAKTCAGCVRASANADDGVIQSCQTGRADAAAVRHATPTESDRGCTAGVCPPTGHLRRVTLVQR